MYCIHCGAKNPDTARFCIECGKPLAAPGAVTMPAAQTATSAAPAERHGLGLWAKVLIGVLIFAVVAVVGVSAARQWAHVGTAATPRLMPTNTVMLIHLAPNPLQLTQLSQLRALAGAFGPLLEDSAGSLSELLESNLEIDLKRDVLSWVGLEFAAGMVSTKVRGSDDYALLVTAAYRNGKKALAFMDKIRAAQESEGWSFDEGEHEGVEVVYGSDGWGGEMAYALVKGFLVLSSSGRVLERVIDTAKGKQPGLDEDDVFRGVLKELPSRRAGYVYLSYDALAKEVDLTDLPAKLRRRVQAVNGMGASFGLTSGGAVINMVMTADQDMAGVFGGQKVSANRALKLAPGESLVYVGGQDLSGNLKTVLSLAGDSSLSDELTDFTGLSMDELIGWATGEYALAVIEDPEGWLGDSYAMPVAGVLILEARDREAATKAMENLVDATGTFARSKKIGGQTFSVVSQANVTMGYGFIGDYLVIGTAEKALEALASAKETSLAEDENLSVALRALPAKNTGIGHLDVQALIDMAYQQMDSYSQEDFDTDVRPYLEPFQSVTFAAEPLSGKVARGAVFIRLEE